MKIVKINTLDGKNVEAAVSDEDCQNLNSFLEWNKVAFTELLRALWEMDSNHEIAIKYNGIYPLN